MTASKRARDEEAGRHAHEVASFEAELVAEVSTPPTRMSSAGLVLACGGQPRRLVLVLLFMLIAVAALMISRQEQIARFARVRTCADRFRQRLNFTDFVKDMKPSRAAFDDVLSRVSPPAKQVAFRAARARKSTGGFVPYSLRLSMALRYMAGGSALDIMYLHGVGRSTFYACLWPTLRAIDAGLPAFSLPEDIKSLVHCRRLAAGSSLRTDGHIQGAITAWDRRPHPQSHRSRGRAAPVAYRCASREAGAPAGSAPCGEAHRHCAELPSLTCLVILKLMCGDQ